MSGEASDILKSAYLTALSQKGETIEEITGSAEEMRKFGRKLGADVEALEIVGTGGDGSNSFNISTTASIVISAAGVPVAKHGNRAASSKSGAADCLEALGVNITIEPEQSKTLLEEIGICFLFAQKYHTAMKYVGPIRKELGIRTIFNILGPLANPAGPVYQIMGAYDESLLPSMAKVLSNLGVKRGMVVYGQDRLDEISASAPTTVCEIDNGTFKNYDHTGRIWHGKMHEGRSGGRNSPGERRDHQSYLKWRKGSQAQCGTAECSSSPICGRQGRQYGRRCEAGREGHWYRPCKGTVGAFYQAEQCMIKCYE